MEFSRISAALKGRLGVFLLAVEFCRILACLKGQGGRGLSFSCRVLQNSVKFKGTVGVGGGSMCVCVWGGGGSVCVYVCVCVCGGGGLSAVEFCKILACLKGQLWTGSLF